MEQAETTERKHPLMNTDHFRVISLCIGRMTTAAWNEYLLLGITVHKK